MTKSSKAKLRVEQRVGYITIACLSAMVVLAITMILRFELFSGGCADCFSNSLFNRVLLGALIGLIIGYIACIPIMVYKVRQSKKMAGEADDDCDEGSCSY